MNNVKLAIEDPECDDAKAVSWLLMDGNVVCTLLVYLDCFYTHLVLSLKEGEVIIPLSHDFSTRKTLAVRFEGIVKEYEDKVYLNKPYRDRRLSDSKKNWVTTLRKDGKKFILDIVGDPDNIYSFIFNDDVEVIAKALDRNINECYQRQQLAAG